MTERERTVKAYLKRMESNEFVSERMRLAREEVGLGMVKAVEKGKANQGRLGVFWHTQGSGKSFAMIFLSQKVLRRGMFLKQLRLQEFYPQKIPRRLFLYVIL